MCCKHRHLAPPLVNNMQLAQLIIIIISTTSIIISSSGGSNISNPSFRFNVSLLFLFTQVHFPQILALISLLPFSTHFFSSRIRRMPPPQRPRSVQERAAAMQTPITANDGPNPNKPKPRPQLHGHVWHVGHTDTSYCKLSVKRFSYCASACTHKFHVVCRRVAHDACFGQLT
jgi:hypothetical protein